jgi:transcriptional regulator with XRE-family HTH domain
MKKQDQDLFYATVGKELTKARERRKLSISQLATLSGEQFNTIKGIEEGRPFMAHQMSWMKEVLGMSLNITVTDACNVNNIPMKEIDNGDKKESYQEESGKKAQSLSDFF